MAMNFTWEDYLKKKKEQEEREEEERRREEKQNRTRSSVRASRTAQSSGGTAKTSSQSTTAKGWWNSGREGSDKRKMELREARLEERSAKTSQAKKTAYDRAKQAYEEYYSGDTAFRKQQLMRDNFDPIDPSTGVSSNQATRRAQRASERAARKQEMASAVYDYGVAADDPYVANDAYNMYKQAMERSERVWRTEEQRRREAENPSVRRKPENQLETDYQRAQQTSDDADFYEHMATAAGQTGNQDAFDYAFSRYKQSYDAGTAAWNTFKSTWNKEEIKANPAQWYGENLTTDQIEGQLRIFDREIEQATAELDTLYEEWAGYYTGPKTYQQREDDYNAAEARLQELQRQQAVYQGALKIRKDSDAWAQREQYLQYANAVPVASPTGQNAPQSVGLPDPASGLGNPFDTTAKTNETKWQAGAKKYGEYRLDEDGFDVDNEYNRLTEEDKKVFFAMFDDDPLAAVTWAQQMSSIRQEEFFAGAAEEVGETSFRRFVGLLAGPAAGLASGLAPTSDWGQEMSRFSEAITSGGAAGQTKYGIFGIEALSGEIDIPVLGKVSAGTFYNIGSSMVQSGLVAIPAMLIGDEYTAAQKVAEFLGTALMGSAAAASDYRERINAGWSEEAAAQHALWAGVWEGTFEYVSLDKLVNQDVTRSFVRNFFLQGGVEASEEFATTIANRITDGAIARKNGYDTSVEERAKELMAEGWSFDGAYEKADQEWFTELMNDAFAGFVSGGGMTATHVAPYAVGNYFSNANERYRSAVRNAERTMNERYQLAQGTRAEEGGVEAVRQYAADNGIKLKVGDGTRARQEVRMGRGIENVQADIAKKMSAAGTVQGAEQVYAQLVEKYGDGIRSVADAALQEAVVTTVTQTKGNTTAPTYQSVMAHREAVEGIQDERARTVAQDSLAAAAYSAAVQSSDESGQTKASDYYRNRGQEMTMQATVTGEDGSERQVSIESVDTKKGVVNLAGGETVKIEDLAADTDTSDMVDLMKSSEMSMDDTAAMIRNFAAQSEAGLVSDPYRWGMEYITTYDRGRVGKFTLEEAQKKAKNLSPEMAQVAYEAGQRSYEQTPQTQREKLNAALEIKSKGATGRAGSIDVGNLAAKIQSDEGLMHEVERIRKFAETFGVDVGLFESKVQNGRYQGENGRYSDGRIWIDINAGRNKVGDIARGMVQTMAHEMTHFMQDYNPESYAEVKRFALQQIIEREGEDGLNRLIYQKQQRHTGQTALTRVQAEDEVVADFCQDLLSDQTALETMAKENPKGFQALVEWVKDFLRKIKDKLAGTPAGSEEQQIYRAMEEKLRNAFGEAWGKGIVGAVQTHDVVGSIKNTAQEGGQLMSREQVEEEYKNPDNLTEDDVLRMLQSADYGILDDGQYMPIRRHSPAILHAAILEVNKILNMPQSKVDAYLQSRAMIMQVYKARQAQAPEDQAFGRSHGHDLTPGQIIDIIKRMAKPKHVGYQGSSERFMEIIHYNADGESGDVVTFFDLNRYKDPVQTQGYKSDDMLYDIAVTFIPVSKKDIKKLVSATDNIVFTPDYTKGVPQLTSGNNVPSVLNDTPFYEQSIPQQGEGVNPSDAKKSDRITAEEDTEYLELAKDPKKNAARLQEMVDEAARRAGYTYEVWHGTNGGDFTVFDWRKTQRADAGWYGRGHYFATHAGEASLYGERVIHSYLKITNPFNFSKELLQVNGQRLPVGAESLRFMQTMGALDPAYFGNLTLEAYDNWSDQPRSIKWADIGKEITAILDGMKLRKYADGHCEWAYDYGGWTEESTKNEYATPEAAEKAKESAAYELLQKRFNARLPIDPAAYYLGGGMDAADRFSEVLKKKGYDGVLQGTNGDEIVVFDSPQIKSADPVTYDDAGKPIPLSKRFDVSNPDIRYSSRESEEAAKANVTLDTQSESAAPGDGTLFSERTWTASRFVQDSREAAKALAKALGVTERTARKYIRNINSVARMIADDRVRLDYESAPGLSSFKSNSEYGGSIDFSTLCKKRRLMTGTFSAIQNALQNTVLTEDDVLRIRQMMKDAGLEVSCGLCYVEGSRTKMGEHNAVFLERYKKYYPDSWQPTMADVTTPDGIERMRIHHPEAYEKFEYFYNHYGKLKPSDKAIFASQQKPKMYQLRTEYNGEILLEFKTDAGVETKNRNGGLRLQSFSDFEIVHLIDCMQVIADMAEVGLAGQAYTKVPEFAEALGKTGLKINLSLITKGLDENGKLVFDDVEGMPHDRAFDIRKKYSKNVGTILVVYDDAQLLAAMADPRIDFIIPFHISQWKKSQFEAMGLPPTAADYNYQLQQNEKWLDPDAHTKKCTNYMPNEYWDFSLSGKQNAERYLEMCARDGKRPKFYKILQNNGDGSYSLKDDGSTDGYWKLLIDFKMYDNQGRGVPQQPVRPVFDMKNVRRMLEEYQGGHAQFPVAQGIVDQFVAEYKAAHPGAKYQMRDYDMPSDTEIIEGMDESTAETPEGKALLKDAKRSAAKFKTLQGKLSDARAEIRRLNELLDRRMLTSEHEAAMRKAGKTQAEMQADIEGLSRWSEIAAAALSEEQKRSAEKLQQLIEERDAWQQKAADGGRFAQQMVASKNRDIKTLQARIEAQARQALQEKTRLEKKLQAQLEREEKILQGVLKPPAIQKMLQDARETAARKANQHRDEVFRNYRERKAITALRKRIRNLTEDIKRRAAAPTDRAYIPAHLAGAMTDLLDILERSEVDTPTPGTKAADRYFRTADKIRKLADAYLELQNDPDFTWSSEYDKDVYEGIVRLAQQFEKQTKDGHTYRATASDLSLAELQQVYDTIREISEAMRNAARMIGLEESLSIFDYGDSVIENQHEIQRLKNDKSKTGRKLNQAMSSVQIDALSAMRAVHMIGGFGDSAIYRLWQNIESGQGKRGRVIMESNKRLQSYKTGKNESTYLHALRDRLDLGIKDVDGKTVKLTKMQALQIYMTWQRENANDNLIHMTEGGIIVRNADLIARGKFDEAETTKQSVIMTPEVIQKIEDSLTAWDRGYIDAARDVFTSLLEQSNKVLYALKHKVHKGEAFYIPEKVAGNYLTQEVVKGGEFNLGIKEAGATKDLEMRSTLPIVIDGLETLLNHHINEMATYIGLAIPIRNFAKVYNMRTRGVGVRATTVSEEISRTWGGKAGSMMMDTLRELQNGKTYQYQTSMSAAERHIQSAFVKASLVGKISVFLKQAASLAAAGSVLSEKALMTSRMLVWPLVTAPNSKLAKNIQARADRLTAENYMRRLGLSMEEIAMDKLSSGPIKDRARLAGAWLEGKGKPGQLVRRGIELLNPTNWIQRMDVATTTALFVACEHQAKYDGFKKGTAEYDARVKELYERVIRETQPMYDALHRPELQKNAPGLAKVAMPFRTVPFQNYGQIMDAAGMLREALRTGEGKKEAAKHFGRTLWANFESSLIFAALGMLAYAIQHKPKRYMDDDDELTWESVLKTYGSDVLDVVIGNLLPYGGTELKDFAERLAGGDKWYDVMSVGSVDLVNKTIKSVIALKEAADKFGSDEISFDELKEEMLSAAKQMSLFMGIPASNVLDIVNGLKADISDFRAGKIGIDRSTTVNARRLIKALQAGDQKKADAVLQEMRGNITANKPNLKEEKVNAQIQNAVTKYIKEQYAAGEMDEATATKYLVEYGSAEDANAAYWKIREWEAKTAHADDEEYKFNKYEDLRQILADGGDITDEVKRLTDHGVKASNVNDDVKATIKDLFLAGDLSEDEAIEYLQRYHQTKKDKAYHPDTADEAWEAVQEWIGNAEHEDDEDYSWSKYEGLREAIRSGEDIQDEIDLLIGHGSKDADVYEDIGKTIKQMLTEGSITADDAEDQLLKYWMTKDKETKEYRPPTENEVWAKVNEWEGGIEHADEEDYSYSQYDAIDEAIAANKDIKGLVKDLTDHGVKQSSITEHVRDYLIDRYAKGGVTESALKNQIARYCGITVSEDVQKIVRNANCKKATGYKYDAIDEAYRAGKVSKTQIKTALTKYGGMTGDEADKKIRYWDVKIQNPDLEIDDSYVLSYYDGTKTARENGHQSASAAKIPIKVYAEVKPAINKITGTDYNGDGRSETYTQEANRIAYISSLNLTDEQKRALYFEYYTANHFTGKNKIDRPEWLKGY